MSHKRGSSIITRFVDLEYGFSTRKLFILKGDFYFRQEQLEPAGKTPDISEPKPEEILVDKAPVMAEKAEEGSCKKFKRYLPSAT